MPQILGSPMAFRFSRKLETFRHFAKSTCSQPLTKRRSIAYSQSRHSSNIQNYTKVALSRGRDQSSRPSQPGSRKGRYNPDEDWTKLIGRTRIASNPMPSNDRQLDMEEPYHLNVYSTKHNTHITWTKPNREPIISKSAGNLNFRKASRGKYDAAYQLTTFMMTKMQEKGLSDVMRRSGKQGGIELIFRGFGSGREAFTKALMSPEGRILKEYIVRVTDATRLKFGGTRSRNVRRL